MERKANQSGFVGVRDIGEQVSVGGGVLLEELTEEELLPGRGTRRRRVSACGHCWWSR